MTQSPKRAGAQARNNIVRTETAEQTESLGRRLGRLLRSGDVIALSGDLGAGKTVLTRGIAQGAAATGYFASPTFTLIREYPGPVPIYHVDLYRLDAPREVEDIGFDEILDQSGAIVIEWAEKIRDRLPAECLWIDIRFTNRESEREVEFIPQGSRYATIAEVLTS
jgi:tRNA threonylcarbamoyladenosine biosynthesis protein TsaE